METYFVCMSSWELNTFIELIWFLKCYEEGKKPVYQTGDLRMFRNTSAKGSTESQSFVAFS